MRLAISQSRIVPSSLPEAKDWAYRVGPCSELESLDLRGTYVTDAGLERLKKLPKLQELYLGPISAGHDDKVTDKGLAARSQIVKSRFAHARVLPSGLKTTHLLYPLSRVYRGLTSWPDSRPSGTRHIQATLSHIIMGFVPEAFGSLP